MEAEAIGSPRSRGHCTKKWQQREAGTGRPDRPLWPDLGAGKKSFGLWPAELRRPDRRLPVRHSAYLPPAPTNSKYLHDQYAAYNVDAHCVHCTVHIIIGAQIAGAEV